MNSKSSWVTTTLGAIAEWGSGGTPSRKNKEYFSGNIPWIKTGELGQKYIKKTEENISIEAIAQSSAKIFPKDSVGIAMYGATIGKLSMFGMDASTNQACAVVTPIQNVIDNEFLYYYLFSEKRAFIKEGKGGAQPNISQGILKDWPICLPPLNEQHRIVAKIEELFSELDKGIESLKTAREQLKVYRQALLKHAFEGKLTEQWRKENADKLETADDVQGSTSVAGAGSAGATQLLERIKQERETRYQQQLEDWKAAVKQWEADGKEGRKPGKPKKLSELKISDSSISISASIPVNWIETYIDSFWALHKKPMTTGPFGTALKKSEHKAQGEPVLGIENIGRGVFESGNKIFVTKSKAKELSSFKVESGDLIISRSGTVGEICGVPPEYDGALISTNLIRVSLNTSSVIPEYFVYLFQGEGVVMQQVRELCKGSSRDFLNQTILKDILFPVPTVDEQEKIVSILNHYLSVADQLDSDLTDNLTRTEALRQSILKKAFSGQLVPQDPNDEPASVLLERIAQEKAEAAAKSQKARAAKKKPKKRNFS